MEVEFLPQRPPEESDRPEPPGLPIAAALQLIRIRAGLSQTAASKRKGAPNYRIISHWESRYKLPSLRLLHGYLRALGLDFRDLQEALDQIEGRVPTRVQDSLCFLEGRVEDLETSVRRLEALVSPDDASTGADRPT